MSYDAISFEKDHSASTKCTLSIKTAPEHLEHSSTFLLFTYHFIYHQHTEFSISQLIPYDSHQDCYSFRLQCLIIINRVPYHQDTCSALQPLSNCYISLSSPESLIIKTVVPLYNKPQAAISYPHQPSHLSSRLLCFSATALYMPSSTYARNKHQVPLSVHASLPPRVGSRGNSL